MMKKTNDKSWEGSLKNSSRVNRETQKWCIETAEIQREDRKSCWIESQTTNTSGWLPCPRDIWKLHRGAPQEKRQHEQGESQQSLLKLSRKKQSDP